MNKELEKDLIRGIKRAEQYLQENKKCKGMKLTFQDAGCCYEMTIKTTSSTSSDSNITSKYELDKFEESVKGYIEHFEEYRKLYRGSDTVINVLSDCLSEYHELKEKGEI